MKVLRLVLIILYALSTSMSEGQSIAKIVEELNKADLIDSSLFLVDTAIDSLNSLENWDSLGKVLILKSKLYERTEGREVQKQLLNENLAIIEEKLGKQHPRWMEIQILYAKFITNEGKFDEAVKVYNAVIVQDSVAKSKEKYRYIAYAGKSFISMYRSQIEDGKAFALKALEGFDDRTDKFAYMQAYQMLSRYYEVTHDYENAIVYIQKNLEIIEEKFGKTHPNVGITYSLLSGIYNEMGAYDKAIELSKKAQEIMTIFYKKTGNGTYLANILGNASFNYIGIGELKLGFEQIEKAIEILEAEYAEDNILMLWHYNIATENLLKDSQYEKAQLYIDKATNIVVNNPEATEYDRYFVKSYQADQYFGIEDYEKSKVLAVETYQYLKNTEDKTDKDLIHILSVIINSYLETEDFAQANRWMDEYQDLISEYYTPIHSEQMSALYMKIRLLLKENKYNNADSIFHEVLTIRNDGRGEVSLAHAIPNMHLIDICALQSASLYERIQLGSMLPDDYFNFLDDFERYYDLHLSTVLSSDRIAVESTTLKEIYHPGMLLSKEDDPLLFLQLSERIKSLVTRIILRNKLVDTEESQFSERISAILEPTNDSLAIDAFVKVHDVLQSLRLYKDSLIRNDPQRYRSLYGLDDLNIKMITASLDEDEMMVEFFRNDTAFYIIYATRDAVTVRSHKFDRVNKLLLDHFNNRNKKSASDLYSLFFPKGILVGVEKLLIMPDDKLYFLNFEELISPSGKYLIVDINCRYAYSASVLEQQIRLTDRARSSLNILGLTPGFSSDLKDQYLQDSGQDVVDSSWLYYIQQPFMVNLASELSEINRSESYIAKQATEANYKMSSKDFKILHLGTHGVLNDASPLFSKLIFAKDSLEDGYLHTYEIYAQNLNADLAVLSACNSGSGHLSEGEGVLSMAHAFTHAGCPSTLMTLWEVDEKATAHILSNFYENLQEGMAKSDALRVAKLDFLKSSPPELQAPYYWAGLVVIGSDAPLFGGNYGWWKYVLAVLILCLFSWVMSRNKRS